MATVFCFEFFLSLLLLSALVSANPEQGKWTFLLNQDKQFGAVAKHMFSGSKVTVSVSLTCDADEVADVEISWLLRLSPCAMEYVTITEDFNANKNKGGLEAFMNNPITYLDMPYDVVELMNGRQTQPCSEKDLKLERDPEKKPIKWKVPKLPEGLQESAKAPAQPSSSSSSAGKEAANQAPVPAGSPSSSAGSGTSEAGKAGQQQKALADSESSALARQKREADAQPMPQAVSQGQGGTEGQTQPKSQTSGVAGGSSSSSTTTSTTPGLGVWDTTLGIYQGNIANAFLKPEKVHHEPFLKAWTDGNYLFVIRFKPPNSQANFTAEVTIRTFYGENSYISALDYPLLIFYGVMGLLYIVFGVVWLLMLACNWRDLLRVQFWIGGVLLLGMLEKAVFFAEYENINNTGVSGSVTLVFAELVSCLKRTLARMLVIIVSLGFGIVKPRLGQTFHKVVLVGGMFFMFSTIEGYMRATSSKVDQSNQFLMAAVPLAVLDAIICWWIFSSLIQTTRTLRLRRNVVKLSLYRHFTNALIFNVLASVAYMVWFLTQHKFRECVKDWKQLWVDEAFWHVLFVVLLFMIIILWRPTANNQRYAFSPLLDAAEEEEEDSLMNDAFEGMKLRGGKNGAPKQRESKNKMEEDLKWVEENIPSSVADKALPAMLDSDEEIMTTKLEMSKME